MLRLDSRTGRRLAASEVFAGTTRRVDVGLGSVWVSERSTDETQPDHLLRLDPVTLETEMRASMTHGARDVRTGRGSHWVASRGRQEICGSIPRPAPCSASQSVAGAVATAGAVSQLDAQIEGYREAWRRVPPSVERIVVLRATPGALRRGATLECVEEAMRDRRPAGRACALPRSQALQPDPAAIAAESEPRAVVVDLTRFFCDARRCLAVVGRALVHRDVSHMTTAFAATLGPYLLRALA